LRLYRELNDEVTAGMELVRFDDEVGKFHEYFSKNVKVILGLEDSPKMVKHHENIEGKEIDYLIVDHLDRVYFVELKLGKNPENRREVISQIIDYFSRCQSYVSTLELPKKAKAAIEKGYVNPIIVTDELLDDHRYILPIIKLGENNIKIRLIEIKRWKSSGEVFATTNSINAQEPIGLPTRETPKRAELLSRIEDASLRGFANKLDELFRKHGFVIKQRSKSRLAYTIGRYNRLFVFVCANPIFPDKLGDFVVTKEYLDIGIGEDLWKEWNIGRSGRQDPWGGEVYELLEAKETERDAFLKFLERVLVATKEHLRV
jgi:hypothetical protein